MAFYLRPDVQKVFDKYDDDLGEFYDKLVGAQVPQERDTLRLRLRAYSYQFGTAAKLVPQVLKEFDLELIFDTAVNERVDSAVVSEMQSKALDLETFGVAKSSLSFEEFKKSLVRIASLCTVSTKTIVNSTMNDDLQPITTEGDEERLETEHWKNASELTGGIVPGEESTQSYT